ncbi:conserved hypothetical protein [Cyanobium sp. PCC 7001]|uniref:hypothetical protein n=1 Tax=Cyanobium sp. PCC 7001 TaxID=180281 RepID=UPI0001804DDB|nr:hypothetical protein [Cyanobium sp. PCC 7001]EDY39340.1 conserved hypothetical protein [Cyanobium sp. PCC 7001]
MSPLAKLPARPWFLPLAGATCLVTLAVPPSQAQAIRDRIIRNQCEAKLKADLVSKGVTQPPPAFVQQVCDCVVQNVNAGATIDAAKETCKAEVRARIKGAIEGGGNGSGGTAPAPGPTGAPAAQ